jgi:lysophospholipase L1-like esterase
MPTQRKVSSSRGGFWRWLGSSVLATILVVASAAITLVLGELLIRHIDGFELASRRLLPTVPVDVMAGPDGAARPHLFKIRLAAGMDRDWFELLPAPPPAPPANPPVTDASARADAAGGPGEGGRLFNSVFVQGRICSDRDFRRSPGFAFVFDPPTESEYPRYRFARNVTTPRGLRTNQFGWRGDQIGLRKPVRTIRIAFVGASATVNDHSYPFSYPELAGFWLNKWIERQADNVRIEVINAGREGITSADIAAIVRDEVLPLEPDLIVYYEGANEFWFDDLIRKHSVVSRFRAWLLRRIGGAEHESAVLRRIANLVRASWPGEHEPTKLNYELAWPKDVDEAAPPLTHPNLPVRLSTILAGLDDIRGRANDTGGELVVSSFFWLVHDGLRLNPERDRILFDYLNTKLFPLRYRDLERLVGFQNRTLKAFATANDTPFIDVASQIPHDPALYWDAVHPTYEGVRLHAWIVAQELAGLLQERLEKNRLPRAALNLASAHPGFVAQERTITFDCSRGATTRRNVVRYADGLVVPGQ